MTADDFITDAIDRGQRDGVTALDPDQRMVFLIAEAEADCDMNGIDTFLSRYAPDWISEAAAAFDAVGATEIAKEMRTAPLDALFTSDPRLDRLNELITDRVGYDYEAIQRVVEERRRNKRCP
jgi:hypothetical protein